ncbi:conserved hypothetical protein [Nostocoides japonicum T1-X7]|uniref:HTH cro/C1-type domain-containing protein n=1 Tax=Nostocoides japonicum T1-X7 TaxID=1194083 RepID=A0A077M1Z2_9MICO|nr:helix-turn-helix transcriptional regulator [Tetrasphaera japonica]CCH78239.1 conserved hypothetical protein [Tetrasphaera japonica T1-X7]
MSRNPLNDLGQLGDYLREQRQSARLSLRQLSELAGVSNPYLSQIERGLKRPSAEILQQLAKGLQVSAESLYVRAGILEERPDTDDRTTTVPAAIAEDPYLTKRQKDTLLDVYTSLVGSAARAAATETTEPTTAVAPKASAPGAAATTTPRPTRKPGATKTTTKSTKRSPKE